MINGMRSDLARKCRGARRIHQKEGFGVLLWEILYHGLKPLVKVYETLLWRWNRARGRLCFDVHGHAITVLPGDPGISRELTIHQTHEPLATRLLQQLLKPGMNVVDVGSNIGYYALLEGRLVGPRGRVIAVEPVQENARQLIRNIRANGYRNIFVHELAIANRSGTAEIHVSQKSNWHSLSPVPWPTTKRRVPVLTLDDLLARHSLTRVDLVRMDLEGYEVVVIEGMQRTLEKYSPRLLVELHPHVIGARPIVEYLRSLRNLGYGVEWLIEQERDLPLRWRFLTVEKPTINELMDDARICRDPRALTVLLSGGAQQSVPAQKEMSDPRLRAPEPRSCGAEAIIGAGTLRAAHLSSDYGILPVAPRRRGSRDR